MDNNQENADRIFRAACAVFGVDEADIRSKSRVREITDARKAIVYFLRAYPKMGSNGISKIINKDHCTISYMFSKAEILMKNDAEFKTKMDRIKISAGLEKNACPCCNRPY